MLQPGGFRAGPITNMNYDCHLDEDEAHISLNRKTFKVETMRSESKVILLKSSSRLIIYDIEKFKVCDSLNFDNELEEDTLEHVVDFIYHKKTRYLYVLTSHKFLHIIKLSKSESAFSDKKNYSWKLRTKDLTRGTGLKNLKSKDVQLCTLAVNYSGK